MLNISRRNAAQETVAYLVAQGVSPVLAPLLSWRGITDSAALDTRLAALPAPSDLKGITAAVERLALAIAQQERICIIADYDADGATACAVGLRGLRAFGATVDYLVPNRFEYGYGLTPEIVALAITTHAPKIIITVDNGIASIEGVLAAKAQGVEVIITDHHLPAAQLPDALIVNPHQPGCSFESKALAGVGVMFYVLMALRKRLNAKDVNLAQWLDLVALGTVADVVPLDRVNRIFVDQGIKRIRAGAMCAGVRALFDVAKKSPPVVVAQDLGFILGPRINAAGRLADISLGIECLITDSSERALEIATALDELNQERREIEATMREEAAQIMAKLPPLDARYSLCLTDPSWHQGVIGIVAGRVKDAQHRPTIVFAPSSDGNQLKGSGRSINGFHLRDALDLVSKCSPTLIDKFGGHAMAAGLTIAADRFDEFAATFERIAQELMSSELLHRVYLSDGAFFAPQVSVEMIEIINSQVWGQNFPAPLFDEDLTVVAQRIVGSKHSKLSVQRGEAIYTALLWNSTETLPRKIHALYRWVVNTFQGQQSVEMIIEAWMPPGVNDGE